MRKVIEIEIDELVLHGFDRTDHESIREAIVNELIRLISENGLPAPVSRAGRYPATDAGKLTIHKGSKAGEIGSGIAGSVYHGMKNLKSHHR